MENLTSNISTNSTSDPSGSHFNIGGLLAFCVIFFVIIFLVLVLDIITSVAILTVSSVRKPIKALLLNLLAANMLTIVTMLLFLSSIFALVHMRVENPHTAFCRVILGIIGIGIVGRLFALAAFSTVILAIVMKGISFISPLLLFISIAVGWTLAIILNLNVFIPPIYYIVYVDNIACFPNLSAVDPLGLRNAIDAIYIIFGGIIPLIICFVVPIIALCYIKNHKVTESRDYTKNLVKFGLFLVGNNFINLLGQTLPSLIAYNAETIGVYLACGFAGLSIVPTPILIILFLKPVRKEVQKRLQCKSLPTSDESEEKMTQKRSPRTVHTAVASRETSPLQSAEGNLRS